MDLSYKAKQDVSLLSHTPYTESYFSNTVIPCDCLQSHTIIQLLQAVFQADPFMTHAYNNYYPVWPAQISAFLRLFLISICCV